MSCYCTVKSKTSRTPHFTCDRSHRDSVELPPYVNLTHNLIVSWKVKHKFRELLRLTVHVSQIIITDATFAKKSWLMTFLRLPGKTTFALVS